MARVWAGLLLAAVQVLPVLAGLWVTLWLALQARALPPGLWLSAALSLGTGLAATLLSLALALGTLARLGARPCMGRLLAPWLALPHAALAIGLAAVIAPSGLLSRLVALLTGARLPPDLATVGDPFGAALTLGLVLKETPFLLLMALAAMAQLDLTAQLRAARSLGAPQSFLRVVLPQLWPLLRFPVAVVLVFSVSVVDMALILGPTTPPTLSVAVLRAMQAPDLAARPTGAALALVQAGVALLALALMALTERALRGRRPRLPDLSGALTRGLAALALLTLLALALLALWSVSHRWPFPLLWPERLTLAPWRAVSWAGPALTSLWLALSATALALALAVLRLETARSPRFDLLLALPLVVPQVSFLFGLDVAFLRMGLTPGAGPVLWAHVLTLLPYLLLMLRGPWAAVPPEQMRSGASLGAGPLRRLLRLRLPLMRAPLASAAAVGVAVSVAQYLPTLVPSAGRLQSLTTEAVTLASGGDRRVAAVTALLQLALPLAAYLLAWRVARRASGLPPGLPS